MVSFKKNLFSSLMYGLTVLGYLPKLERGTQGTGLVFTAGFPHTFFINMLLIKYPIK